MTPCFGAEECPLLSLVREVAWQAARYNRSSGTIDRARALLARLDPSWLSALDDARREALESEGENEFWGVDF